MDQLDEIRSKIDIVSLISEYLPLKKAGRNFKALCPFHQEKQPSFIVSPERQIFKCFGCFPAGTQIKTPEGFHAIDQIKQLDQVVSGKGHPTRVIFTHKRDYQGKMIQVFLRKLGEPVTLTEDHQVFIVGGPPYTQKYKNFSKRFRKYESLDQGNYNQKLQKYFPIKKISAGDLKTGDRLLYPIDQKIKDLKEINLKKFITKTLPSHGRKPRKIPYIVPVEEDFLKLLGYWVAEGSNHRAYIRFSLGNHEEDLAEEIRGIVKKLFSLETKVHRRKQNDKTGLELTCCHSFLANIFENLCGKGAENKHIPFIFQDLPPEKQEVILKAILRGDGYTRKLNKSHNFHHEITTVSPILAEQLRDIILRLGFFPTESVGKARVDRKSISHKKTYKIMWSEEASSYYRLTYKEKDGVRYWILPVKRMKKHPFKGLVYNLTLEKDHSYITRNFMVANCGEGGDIFTFLMRTEGMEFGEALQTLAKRAGVKLISYRPRGREAEKEKLYGVNHLTSEFYHYLLLNHPVGKKALNYILGRGIIRDSIKRFKLGFAPSLWNGLQRFLIGKKGYKPDDLQKAGLVTQVGGQTRDFFRERIIFPLKDHRGNVVGFSGRVLPGESETVPKYINIAETPVYQKGSLLYGLDLAKEAIKKERTVVVVEGEFDVISSFQAGVENVVAIKGSALSQDQSRLLKRFAETLIFALDRDIAGDAASRRGIEIADSFGFDLKVVRIPEGKDPDELAQKSPQAWEKAIDQAVPVYDFFIDSACSRFDKASPSGKRRIGDEVLPVLKRITNDLVKAHYVKILAEKLDLPEEALLAEIEKISLTLDERPSLPEKKEEKPSRHQLLEEYLFSLLLQTKKERQLLKRNVSSLVKTPALARIIKLLRVYFKKRKRFSSSSFAKTLPQELVEIFNGFFLKDLGGRLEDEDWCEKEVLQALFELEKLDLGQKLRSVSREIASLEGQKKPKGLKAKKEEFRLLSQTFAKLRKKA